MLHEEGLDDVVCRTLRLDEPSARSTSRDGSRWSSRLAVAARAIRVGVVGKYVNLPDAYLSVVESLRHAGFHHWARVDVEFMQAEDVPDILADRSVRPPRRGRDPRVGSASGASRARSQRPAMRGSTTSHASVSAWGCRSWS